MKKFYSLVLMVTALLIGTNVSAATFSGNTAAELQDAIYAIMSGSTSDPVIKLSQNVDLNRTVWVGTQNESDDFKSVTIDLNGHNISMQGERNAQNKRVLYIMFSLTHGELKFINSSASEAKVQLTGETADNSRIVEVFGTYRSSRWNEDGTALAGDGINTRDQGWFSHLEIGQNVLLYADQGCLAEGIAVGVQGTRTYYKDASNQVTTTYGGWLFKGSSYGYAQGARVDFWGKMDIQGAADGKVYGFATKGLLRSALSVANTGDEVIKSGLNNNYATNYYNYNGEVEATSGVTHKLDTIDAAFVWIHPESEIKVRNNGSKVAAIYAAGYAKWLVQGYAEGKTGLYASSGTIDLEDAYVKSTAEEWQNTSNIGSANGGGSGVVLNSRDSYAGDIEFVVSGDTKIESIDGYAIEEAVNTTTIVPNPKADPENPNYDPTADPYIPATNVSSVTIESGTIVGGDKGAIIISGPTSAATANTDPEAQSTVVVYGGNVTGSTTVGVNPDGLDELMPTTGDYHQTEIEVGGKTVIVISQGEEPDTDQENPTTTWSFIKGKADEAVAAEQDAPNYQWTEKEDATIASGVVLLGELQITAGTGTGVGARQQLTIADGATLQVERLVMNSYARLIVEAGGKLIVTGGQGINAPVIENILLKNEENKPAVFLFNPAVTSNKHPNGTVEFLSKGFNNTATSTFGWQKFGVPTQKGELTEISIEGNIPTAFGKFNYEAATPAWEVIGYLNHTPALDLNDLNQSFEYYQMEHNTATVGTKVTFKGKLVGNDCPAPAIRANFWNGYANSYSAPIDAEALLNLIPAPADKAFYLYEYDVISEKFSWVAKSLIKKTDIQPMQPFLVRNPQADATALALDYGAAVYNPAVTPSNEAPARQANDMTKAEFIVRGENGVDHVIVAQDAQFSAEFDNGYDVAKYMNDDVNMYVSADEKMAIFATDDLANTYLGFQTVNGGNYTIEFANVQGEDLTLIDHETNARVAMVAGNTYQFSAAANSSNDYRFEIVNTFNAPTAIENTEAVKSAKGIYTITGQYVGEMNVWNSLPAGVYVIDGAKRVK